MKKLYLIILALVTNACLSSSFAQVMVVEDIQGNKLKKFSLKIQAIERKVSTASNILLNTMSGDVTRTMEQILRQNEILENSSKLRNTLGDVVTVSSGYQLFKGQANATHNAIRRVDAKLKDAQKAGALDESTIRRVNASLSRIRYALGEAADLWSAATDLNDEIDRIIRLQKIKEAEHIILEIENKQVPELIAEIDAEIYERITKPQELSFILPPTNQSLGVTSPGGTGDPDREGYKSDFNSKVEKLSELWKGSVDEDRMMDVLKIVFSYGEILAGIIVSISLWFIVRSRNTGKTYAVVKNIVIVLIAIVLMKVLAFNII